MVAASIGGSALASSGSSTSLGGIRSSPASRRIGRPVAVTTPESRPPVLLEITETCLRCGIVGADPLPKHVFPLESCAPPFFESEPAETDSASLWYSYLAPIVKHAYQRLGLGAKERKAIVLFRGLDDRTLPRSIERALLTALIDNVGVPAVNLQCSNASMIPYSLPMLTHMLVVYIGSKEATCQAYASNENLPFTYQNVPLNPQNSEEATVQSMFLDYTNPNSVLTGMLSALEACPMAVRKSVIANIVFCGTGLFQKPQLPLVIVKQLKYALQQGTLPVEKAELNPRQLFPESEPVSVAARNGSVPLKLKSLAGLEPHVGLVKTPMRPDLLAWVGASQWAAHWHGRDPLLQKWSWHTKTNLNH